jgi:hypothetical protein
MSARSLRVYSVGALAGVSMMSFSVDPVSAFTLSSPSLEPSFASSQIENAYYYYHYHYYHPYYYHHYYYHPYYHRYYHPYYYHPYYYHPYYHRYYHYY